MGSKGLPGKNSKLLHGKPLIAWTIEQALASHSLDEVIVSTDSLEIAEISKAAGAKVPFIRPAHLASDECPSIDVIEHALEWMSEYEKKEFHYTALLEPTSPLREKDDIDNMLLLLDSNEKDFDGVVSLGLAHHHPSILKRLDGSAVRNFSKHLTASNRRQDDELLFFPFGVAYILKTDSLRAERTFYAHRSLGYRLKRYQEYEIDDVYDFMCVEKVMGYQWNL